MNKAAAVCWTAAVLFATGGMAYGIMMAASGNHTLAPAHAHNNLIGWVTLALYGTFYQLVPRAAEGWAARIQIALAIIGTLIIVPGIARALRHQGETMAQTGSLVTIAAMILFVVIVVANAWRGAHSTAPARHHATAP